LIREFYCIEKKIAYNPKQNLKWGDSILMSGSPLLLILAIAFLAATTVVAQSGSNYLAEKWNKSGETVTEMDGVQTIFVLRNQGSFSQDVSLPKGSSGKFVLFIGRCSSERVEPDGVITGLPYLYGYMHSEKKIEDYLQNMLCRPGKPDVWVTTHGVFKIPPNANRITYFLNQAERRYVPQNGSAARFADVGLYIFDTEVEARTFVADFNRKY